MNYLHYDLNLQAGEVVEVTLDKQANVRLLDYSNYLQYQRGAQHRYYGGLAQASPIRIAPPSPGNWHLVIDLGGHQGTVAASVRTIRGQA